MFFEVVVIFFSVKELYTYDLEDVVSLRATIGRDAHLPCGQDKIFLDGENSYIVWLKDDSEFLYRFPSENSKFGLEEYYTKRELCDESSRVCNDKTSLHLKDVGDDSAGIYRCRVHYQTSPSLDYIVNVILVASPGVPKVFYEDAQITQGYIGPLAIGSTFTLVCQIENADDNTQLYWRRNGRTVKTYSKSEQENTIRLSYTAENIDRNELDAHYDCIAQNSDVSDPLLVSVAIKMFLAPTSVSIRLNNNYAFGANQPRIVDCVVVNCVPPPTITWQFGTNLLKANTHKELNDGNFTVSSLSLTPTLQDNEKELTCRAHNSYIPDEKYQDSVVINVGHRPVCATDQDEPFGIMEKESETITCSVHSVPEPYQFAWTFNGTKTVYTSPEKVPGEKNRYRSTLTFLPNASDFGELLCKAVNKYGEQQRPCTFKLLHGGPPETPQCQLMRAYPDSIRVQCKKGFDGGRSQKLYLELSYSETGETILNESNTAGHFHLSGLDLGRNLTINVFAFSSRGYSKPTLLRVDTLPPLATGINEWNGEEEATTAWNAFLWRTLIPTILILLAICVIVLQVLRRRRRQHELQRAPDIITPRDGQFHREPDFVERTVENGRAVTITQLPSFQSLTNVHTGDTFCVKASYPSPCMFKPISAPGTLAESTNSGAHMKHCFYV